MRRKEHDNDANSILKDVSWRRKEHRVLYQLKYFGPCWIIGIYNYLVLQGRLNFDSLKRCHVSKHLLITRLIGLLKNTDYFYKFGLNEAKTECRRNFERWWDDGIYTNVHFSSPTKFGLCPMKDLFDSLNIPVFHGWIPDPSVAPFARAIIMKHDYDNLTDLVANRDLLMPDHEIYKFGDEIFKFVIANRTRITLTGLQELEGALSNGEVGILFHNCHFSTVVKHMGSLYLLVTSKEYYYNDLVVFKKLSPNGSCEELFDGDFNEIPLSSDLQEDITEDAHDFVGSDISSRTGGVLHDEHVKPQNGNSESGTF